MSMVHHLKIHPEPFAAVRSGIKMHEIRLFDRPYAEGDFLFLQEYRPAIQGTEGDIVQEEGYTGESEYREVTHITKPGTWGLPPNVGVMSIRPVSVVTP